MKAAIERSAQEYETSDGEHPFSDWIQDLEAKARVKVIKGVSQLKAGNFSNSEPVGKGVSEHKIHYGPGYRVYYVIQGDELIILLCGGDKSTQKKDIETALEYFADYKARKKTEEKDKASSSKRKH